MLTFLFKIHFRCKPRLTCAALLVAPFVARGQDFDPFASESLPEKSGHSAQSSASPGPSSKTPETEPGASESAPIPSELTPSSSSVPSVPRTPLNSPKTPPITQQKTQDNQQTAPNTPRKKPAPVKRNPQIKPKPRSESVPVEDVPPPSQPKTGDLRLDANLESIQSLSYFKPAFDVASYTNNRVLLPLAEAQVQLRPLFRLSSGRAFTLNLRPYFEIRNRQSMLSQKTTTSSTEVMSDLGESFVTLNASNRIFVTAGQENFQWGNTEISSPSNWIFRSTELAESLIRNPQTRVKTRRTVRMNFSAGQFFSLVTMAEFEAEKRTIPALFGGRRFLVKPELSWNSGVDYFGFVVGGAERLGYPFLGEYMSVSLGDSMSIYADAAHYRGSEILRPKKLSLFGEDSPNNPVIFEQGEISSKRLNHEVVLGVSYGFEDGTQIRFEGFSSTAGYSLSDNRLTEQIYQQKSPLFPIFFSPGVETRAGKSLLFVVRKSNFGKKKNWTVLGRYWKPVLDSSGGAVAYIEHGLNDNATLYLAAGGFHGGLISDAASANRFVITMGQKYVW